MSRLARFANALEEALETRHAVLVFGGWRPIGSPPANTAALLLSCVHRFASLPLNPVIAYAPFARIDDLALERTVRVAKVVHSRQKAKIARWQAGRQLPRDLQACDWDVAAQLAAREDPRARIPLKSFVALDRVTSDGRLEPGNRPALGRHAKRGGDRLPQMCVLTARSASDSAIGRLFACDLLLVNVTGARGSKTVALMSSILERAPADLPTVIVAEGSGELSRFGQAPALERMSKALSLSPSPLPPRFAVRRVGESRVQYEEQFRFAMPSDDLSPLEEEVARLGMAAWRQRWRTVNPAIRSSTLTEAFLKSLAELHRRSSSSGDRFNMFQQLLNTSERDASASATDRLAAVKDAALKAAASSPRILVIVGGAAEENIISQALSTATPPASVIVGTCRHLTRSGVVADSVIVSGYYGPATTDGVLRALPSNVVWVVDPVEAYQASSELHRQAALFSRLGLSDEANLLGSFDSSLGESTPGIGAGGSTERASLFGWEADGSGAHPDPSGDDAGITEEVDIDANYLVVLLDGTRLRVNANRRFDVLRSQSPHPLTVPASELQEGDEVVLVRGSFQKTLSELLLEEMDRTELKNEAGVRRTWVTMVQTAMDANGLTVERVVRSLRTKGIHAPPERVRSWLRDDDEETTPLNWSRFLSFARVVGVGLEEEQIRYFFDTIKRWRVGHRIRGRAVVRALRHVRLGGLSAADMARIESEWGLGVRDLIEGSRVEEVEAVVQLQ